MTRDYDVKKKRRHPRVTPFWDTLLV